MTIHQEPARARCWPLILQWRPSVASEPSDDGACVDALAQLEVLRLGTRVFKPDQATGRNYLHDRDRPAEIERLEQLAEQDYGTDPARRQAQAASASRTRRRARPGLRGCARAARDARATRFAQLARHRRAAAPVRGRQLPGPVEERRLARGPGALAQVRP
ncbi:MAG: hypothetical protein MZV70_33720 [Desulfobacterales bacterium]|nr:hypothetical protein [Desulfobacterales bacterium]